MATLSDLLLQRASEHPKRACIKYGDKRYSYFDIDRLVTLKAGGLRALGLAKGDRAAILMGNSPGYIISYFAIQRAGGIAVPINTFLTPDDISFIINDSGCRAVIYDTGFSETLEKPEGELDAKMVLFDEIPDAEAEPYRGKADDTAVFLYTSGTTGFPKAAMLTHRNLISNVESCIQVMRFSCGDRALLFLPLFHSFTFTVCVILPIYSGASIILLPSVKPFSRVIKTVIMERITFFVAIPTIYNILSRKKIPLLFVILFNIFSKIRVCVSGAAALPPDIIEAFETRFRAPLIEGYGLTEASPVVAVNPVEGPRKPSSVGLPLPGVEVSIIGEDGHQVPSGEIGELRVKGPNVMKGYYNRPDETSSVLRDGWLHTGDMARIDEDSYIYIVDRKKDLIIVDGMNVYPREIEDVIIKHESVEECAMVGIPDGRGSEISILFIKKKEGSSFDEAEIRDRLKRRLARFKVPRRIVLLDEFPKTATGKIKKAELRNLGSG